MDRPKSTHQGAHSGRPLLSEPFGYLGDGKVEASGSSSRSKKTSVDPTIVDILLLSNHMESGLDDAGLVESGRPYRFHRLARRHLGERTCTSSGTSPRHRTAALPRHHPVDRADRTHTLQLDTVFIAPVGDVVALTRPQHPATAVPRVAELLSEMLPGFSSPYYIPCGDRRGHLRPAGLRIARRIGGGPGAVRAAGSGGDCSRGIPTLAGACGDGSAR